MIFKKYTEKINLIESKIGHISLLNEQIISEIKKVSIEKLPYDFDELDIFIDSETMKTHYNKHYKGYVEKLNSELEKVKGKDLDLEEIVSSISKFNTKVRNNGGGAFNHALFWKMLSPKRQKPSGEIFEKITKQYGNIKKMKDEFNQSAKDRFGSGWVWLVLTKTGRLKVVSTPNQDNPMMSVVKDGGYPLLGLDVWEHAYYLRYRNKRDEYIKKFWDHVNWEFVNELYLLRTNK
jgi:Fe-Mn family superoxide dismutase